MNRAVLIIVVVCIHSAVLAAEDERFRAALELHNVLMESDEEALVGAVMGSIAAQAPGEFPPEILRVIREFIVEIVRSDDYSNMKAAIYSDHLSVEQLEALTRLVQTPEYRAYADALPSITTDSGISLNRLIQDRQQVLDERLIEAWQEYDAQ